MKEIIKTAAMWTAIIGALPVFIAAAKGIREDRHQENGESGSFVIEGAAVLRVYDEKRGEIIEMPLEEYTARAVIAELGESVMDKSRLEAAKAQAVAARTYGVRRLLEGMTESGDGTECHMTLDGDKYQICLTDEEIKALYGEAPYEAWEAAAETEGEILVYNNSPIIAAFHAASGGLTESAENVWGIDEPYLTSVESQWDKQSEYYNKTRIFTDAEIESRIAAETGERRDYDGIELLSVTDAGRVQQLRVCGAELTGERFAELFTLDSAVFAAQRNDGETVITTKGRGHMAGMSISGAAGMAEEGASYIDILEHYYKGAQVVKAGRAG